MHSLDEAYSLISPLMSRCVPMISRAVSGIHILPFAWISCLFYSSYAYNSINNIAVILFVTDVTVLCNHMIVFSFKTW